jgi:hypothetical protein
LQTATATVLTTASVTRTVTNFVTTVTVTSVGATAGVAKRQATLGSTPAPLVTYPADYITSGCSLAVPAPTIPSTVSKAVTVTATQTVVQTATQTIQAASTVVVTCARNPITNGGFESGAFTPWTTYNPIGGAGGSWTLASGRDATRGAYVAQVSLLNPDTSKYGGFSGYIQQVFSTCIGASYSLTFSYQCTLLNNGLAVYATVASTNINQIACAAANTWYTASMTWTATTNTATIFISGVQNGVTQGIIQFDNVVATLNTAVAL